MPLSIDQQTNFGMVSVLFFVVVFYAFKVLLISEKDLPSSGFG
jgi:hypothetical protein